MKIEDVKILGFDLDGVIVDHTDLKLKLAKEKGYDLLLKETHSNVIKNRIPKDILREIQLDIYCRYSNQLLIEGAKEILQKIKESKIPFYLISRRRTGDAREKAIEILKNRGLWPKVFNEKNVNFVETPEEKNETAKKLGVTHYFDDEIDVLEAMTAVKNRYLFDSFDNFPNSEFRRVRSWEELRSVLFS